MLRETAEDILVYERVILKRWLRGHGGFEESKWEDVEYLIAEVRRQGGDPELLRSRGRDIGVATICETKGYI